MLTIIYLATLGAWTICVATLGVCCQCHVVLLSEVHPRKILSASVASMVSNVVEAPFSLN
jgi:hypothetical protein